MKLFKTLTVIALASGFSTSAMAATFDAEFWDATTTVDKVADAVAIIEAGPATATFESTGIDYPQGSDNIVSDSTALSDFLGTDADSLVGPAGVGDTNLTNSVFRFTGFLDLLAGEQTFSVGSDDGFRLTIDGVEISSAGARSFSTTSVTVDAGEGITAFELIYFERTVVTGVNFSIDGVVAAPADPLATVPLPAGLPLGLLGLGALGLLARRQKTS